MAEFIKTLLELFKDKLGRKQIITLLTIGVLAYLAIEGFAEEKITMAIVNRIAIVGALGIVSQAILDWFKPRQ